MKWRSPVVKKPLPEDTFILKESLAVPMGPLPEPEETIISHEHYPTAANLRRNNKEVLRQQRSAENLQYRKAALEQAIALNHPASAEIIVNTAKRFEKYLRKGK